MKEISVGELVRQAKGEDRSLREYARDSGVDAAIISKIINGSYVPKRPGIYASLTSLQAAPRGGVTTQQMLEAANTSDEYRSGISAGMALGIYSNLADVPSSAMISVLQARGIIDDHEIPERFSSIKPEEASRAQCLKSEMQRFAATANGIVLGSLGRKGLVFQAVHTDGVQLEKIHFDTCVKLMNHDVTEYLIRYAFFSGEGGFSPALAENTMRRMVEELVFLKPSRERKVSVITNHPDAYDGLCVFEGQLSYNGSLSVVLFDFERAVLLKETCLAQPIGGEPVRELPLI